MNIDKEAFEYSITKIDDGIIFEKFGLSFINAIVGHNFIAVGGTKDKGIDGFNHTFHNSKNDKTIYQLSTEKTYEDKIRKTIIKLRENEINYDRLYYVTNRKVNNAEQLVDEIYDEFKIPLVIWDIRWFKSNCNRNEPAIDSFRHFVDTYLHEFNKPGVAHVVSNLDSDSRIYVFLSQQFDSRTNDLKLDDLLTDTLILYALEGTDPDCGELLETNQIKDRIKKYLKFDPQLLEETIEERLQALSTKPRQIKYHSKEKGYCLPYTTRLNIAQRNIKDEMLLGAFHQQTAETIKKYFEEDSIRVRDLQTLIEIVLHKIYERQGLEFSNFVLKGDNKAIIEQNLGEVIGIAVDESSVVLKNKEKVKTAIHLSIREIVYNGTTEQNRFLRSLSNTYLMMFLLQWEPKISTYFQTLASKLNVFVGTSVIIPAFSEVYLDTGNKRHWTLLQGAKDAGISLFINESSLDELVSHFHMIKKRYFNDFYHNENFYTEDECELFFIDKILIRAYFYARKQKRVKNFDDFLNNFIDPNLKQAKQELIMYLKDVFNIQFISNESWDIKIDENEKLQLTDKLEEKKGNRSKAESDAEMILAIYHLRSKNNESSTTGIFGYKTWWLSKDTKTYSAVEEVFGDKYPVSCYIRPDFIYNYIALRPSTQEVEEAYQEIFPTMLGVNLSYHMPNEVQDIVNERLEDFHDKENVRVKQILRNLGEKLKSDPSLRNRHSVELYMDSAIKELTECG